jgi:hypothetical protein
VLSVVKVRGELLHLVRLPHIVPFGLVLARMLIAGNQLRLLDELIVGITGAEAPDIHIGEGAPGGVVASALATLLQLLGEGIPLAVSLLDLRKRLGLYVVGSNSLC